MPRDLLLFADGRPRIDLDLLHPGFVERLLDVLAACRKRGADYMPTRGTATFAEQAALHAAWKAGKGGRAAPAGESAHNYGLAVDLARDGNVKLKGLQPVYRREDYAILVEECERVGLVSGAKFNDMPHVQWPGYVTASQLAPLKGVYETTDGHVLAKLNALWVVVDAGKRFS